MCVIPNLPSNFLQGQQRMSSSSSEVGGGEGDPISCNSRSYSAGPHSEDSDKVVATAAALSRRMSSLSAEVLDLDAEEEEEND